MDRESKRFVRCAAVAAAILFPTFYGCSGNQAPSAPTVAEPLASVSAAPAGATGAVSVTWTCFTASGTPFSGACGAAHSMAPSSRLAPASLHAAAIPFAPGGLTQSVTGSTVTLSWTSGAATSDPVYSYIIEAGSSSGLSNITDNFDTGSSQPGITVTGVGAGTYFVRVRARSTAGISVPSNEVVVVVVPVGATCSTSPDAPTGLASLVNGTTVQLAWAVPQDSCRQMTYMLEAGSSPGASNLANIATGAPSFSASGVSPGTYYVRVRARNANGISGPSNEAIVVVR